MLLDPEKARAVFSEVTADQKLRSVLINSYMVH